MAHDEQKTQLALRRTLSAKDLTEVIDNGPFVKPEDYVVILAEDMYALRETALARGDFRNMPMFSYTLDQLDHERAVYGDENGSITISRASYNYLKAPGRITAHVEAETGG